MLYLAGVALGAIAVLLVLPSIVRSFPDCCRSWQLRWSRSSEVRPDLISSLRTGRPAATPARAREVLAYVASMRRGMAVLASRPYRVAGALFTICGLIWAAEGVLLDAPRLVPCAVVLTTYPLWTWCYIASVARKLDRAEAANADLAQRPELYLVRPVDADCISN